ncbi:putative quinol monooxygenase [Paenibacillus sp. UNC451MF]|uniref:putative quinol monooxygenase n=1 Tax=Paenibacillus sp. UNC451MF TaxID=1449063 RepID=UPI00048A4E14|nr:putative quinol monooxygenase [Paenibacillus sp. UNC451MF]
MIIVHASMQVDPAKEELFLKEIKSLIAASRNESGNRSYDLYKNTEKENSFTMVEIWQDQAAVASHNGSEHFKAFLGMAKQYLISPLEVKAFSGEPLNG